MSTLFQMLGPYIDRKEALAEAVLLRLLQSKRSRKKFAALVCPDKRFSFVRAEQQVWNCDGEARHDIVLVTATGREFMLELKFDAPFTARQLRALGLGGPGRPKNEARIDVLIVPAARVAEVSATKRNVAIVSWEDVDRALQLPGQLGRFSDLGCGASMFDRSSVIADARSLVTYMRGDSPQGNWHALWAVLNCLRRSLSEEAVCRRISQGGNRVIWYGLAIQDRRKRDFWVGWCFTGGARGQFKACLVLRDIEKRLPENLTAPLPKWAFQDDVGIMLWEMDRDDAAHLNGIELASRVRNALASRGRGARPQAA